MTSEAKYRSGRGITIAMDLALQEGVATDRARLAGERVGALCAQKGIWY